MRTYLALAAKAREFDQDPRVKAALDIASTPELAEPSIGKFSSEAADRLLNESFDPDALAARTYGNEVLDQLVIDRILGI
jgi:xylose isomerase